MNKQQAFTVTYDHRSNVLVCDVEIMNGIDPVTRKPYKSGNYKAIWDTGATNTMVTQRVIDDLNLRSHGVAKVNHVQGVGITQKYMINVGLPNGAAIRNVEATRGELIDHVDVLIGMDVICCGDLSITNFDNRTVFSFRIPPSGHIDFVKELEIKEMETRITPLLPKTGRNAKCPCGSGKKYKKCCGSS